MANWDENQVVVSLDNIYQHSYNTHLLWQKGLSYQMVEWTKAITVCIDVTP